MSIDRPIPTGAEAREAALALRRALPPAETERLSREVVTRFLAGSGVAPEQWRGRWVALYRALPGELDLRALEPELQRWGAKLCFPRVLDRVARRMEFAAAPPVGAAQGEDPSFEMAPGAYGIEEPPAHFREVAPELLDVIFLPGAAFGLQGERVGMGAGFYDRFLPQATRALRVALAFDFQLLPAIKQNPWDQRADWIWTERRQVRLRAWP